MREKPMDELINILKATRIDYQRKAGSMKMGIASHYWSGKADGIRDAIDIVDGGPKSSGRAEAS